MLSVHAGGAGIPPAVKAGHWSTSQQKPSPHQIYEHLQQALCS